MTFNSEEDEEEEEQAENQEAAKQEEDAEAHETEEGEVEQPKKRKRRAESDELVEFSEDELQEVNVQYLNAEITQLEGESCRCTFSAKITDNRPIQRNSDGSSQISMCWRNIASEKPSSWIERKI